MIQQGAGQHLVVVCQRIYDVEVVLARKLHGSRLGPKPPPDIGQEIVLPDEFGPLFAANRTGQAQSFQWALQGRAFGKRLGRIKTQRGVHLGAQKRA